jgi:hypothetical protein
MPWPFSENPFTALAILDTSQGTCELGDPLMLASPLEKFEVSSPAYQGNLGPRLLGVGGGRWEEPAGELGCSLPPENCHLLYLLPSLPLSLSLSLSLTHTHTHTHTEGSSSALSLITSHSALLAPTLGLGCEMTSPRPELRGWQRQRCGGCLPGSCTCAPSVPRSLYSIRGSF